MAPKILVVEDAPDWQETLGSTLRDAGYSVDCSGTADDAIRSLEASQYDLALLDIRLDDSMEDDDSGLVLAKEIKQRWPDLKLIFVTGYATQSFVRRAMRPPKGGGESLAVNFVTKDRIDTLNDIVARTLS